MLNKSIILFCSILFVMSCSNTVKGPVTGNKYKVNVGGWGNMNEYKDAREEAITPDDTLTPTDKPRDCNVVDCPDMIKKGQPY